MSFANLLDTAASGADQAAQGGIAPYSSLIMLVLMFVVFYFILIRPQKKREKETAKMRSNLEIGDEVVTIGGIVGIVVSLKEDTVVIETGSDRSKIRFLRAAIQQNNTPHEDLTPVKSTEESSSK
ncbi:preprotein translocase subunit YajC [Clostridiaceae bacterium NSJ-31]|uniref:Preprotein translocase subunit YajC n=1 Tax=Ligaoa zhengdingensis TaxID=2763658 RepID=A0A926I3X0_9FIRM|nr:preprotein translocase subunit YajC [Ligaoa zhengdingensis]MBC8545586.1 preprotein translocase subunit YajC [Ligaoa zhengdingensis]